MRVLIFHGYLLRGTGSNVYNAELGQALVRAGHELHMLCQDRAPLELPWVDAAGDWDGGELQLTVRRDPPRATVYRPDLGGLLPVYVADRYEGVEARPFQELSEEEVERYVARNVAAVAEVVERARPDVALANHLVMGPLILARAGLCLRGQDPRQRARVHRQAAPAVPAGRARGDRGRARRARRLAPHRGEPLGRARRADLPARTRLGPPGVDVDPLRAAPLDDGPPRLGGLRERLEAAAAAVAPAAGPAAAPRRLVVRPLPAEAAAALGAARPAARPDRRLRRQADRLEGGRAAARRLAARARPRPRRAAARRRVRRVPRPRSRGWRPRSPAATSRPPARCAPRTGAGCPSSARSSTRSGPTRTPYRAAAAGLEGTVHWAGRLEHSELADVLPAADAMAMPSTFPEAFGMVAAEAAACGALPVVAGHSGMAEVARALAAAVPPEVRPWLTFEVGPHSVTQLADGLASWLEAPEDQRAATREAIVGVARERYSWDGVARTMIAAAEGRVGELPPP